MTASGDSSELVVVEVARRGKLVVGEPYFTAGTPLLLDRKGLGDAGPGDLVAARRTRGRARVERVLGSADRIENVLEALLVETGARQEFEPYTPPDRHVRGARRPARAADVHDRPRDREGLRRRALDRRRARVRPHRRRLVLRRRRLAARPRRGRNAASRPTSRASSRRCCRTSSRTTSAACARTSTGSASRSSCRWTTREPTFYRSVIRSDARLSYGQAQRILAGDESFAARRRPAAASTNARASCGAAGSRAVRCGSRRRRSSSTSTAAAASRARTEKASRRRTRSSRSS